MSPNLNLSKNALCIILTFSRSSDDIGKGSPTSLFSEYRVLIGDGAWAFKKRAKRVSYKGKMPKTRTKKHVPGTTDVDADIATSTSMLGTSSSIPERST